MRKWANEMVLARQSESLESWFLHGPNLLLKGDEVETLSEMIQMAAIQTEFRYVRVPAANVSDLVECPQGVCTAKNFTDSNHLEQEYANYLWRKYLKSKQGMKFEKAVTAY